MKNWIVSVIVGVSLTLGGAGAQAADAYPSRRVTFVVPFTPGGAGDLIARVIAAKLAQDWGQPVVVENRAGAGGNTGSAVVAAAPPDGYTILIGSTSSHAINPSLYSNMPYDVLRDFSQIVLVASSPHILLVNPEVQAQTLAEFIAYARARPGKLNFASGGNGTSTHLAGELFKTLTGTSLVHVPYRGAPEAVHGVIGGDTQMMFENLSGAIPQVKAGKLRALGVTSKDRITALPDLPTVAGTVPNFETSVWFGIWAPARTPAEIAAKLNADINRVLKMPDVRERMETMGMIIKGGTQRELEDYVRSETIKWAEVVKSSGATIN
jgi:tripartite-type tricarboxylate transporter receptor subunit TctC